MKDKIKMILIIIFIYLSMLILNIVTPLIMDDYNYTFGLEGRINSIIDIINYQQWFYFNWGGRNIAHFIAQFFLMNDKIFFNIVNPAIYTLMIYLIYNLIKGNKKGNPLFLLLIHLGLWFLTPSFGQSFLWLTGASNYLWTTTIILIFLNIFFYLMNSTKKYKLIQIIAFGILGIISGWTNENSGASLIFIMLIYIFIKKVVEKSNIKKIQWIGILGVFIGFIIMIIAPGNYVRSSGFQENSFFLIKWMERALSITQSIEHYYIIIIGIIIVLLSIYIYKKQKIDKKVFIFLIGAFISAYSMIVSPTFPERSWTIFTIYMIIICGLLLNNININNLLRKIVIVDCIIILSILFINSYILTFKDSYHFYQGWKDREHIIKEGKKKKVYNYEFENIYTTQKQSASYGLGDLYSERENPINKTYARYFNVKSIKAKDNN